MADYSRTRRQVDESESFFCRFTFGQFFALLVLEVFTLFFVFYLGARYGREFLGLDREPPVTVVGEAPAQFPAQVTTTQDPEARRIASELVSKAQTPELKERIKQMMGGESEQQPAAEMPEQPIATPPPAEEPAEPVAAATPEEGPMPFRSQQASGTESEGGVIRVKSAENARYSIQIGSYQNMNEANTKAQAWKQKGYPSYVMIADIPNRGRWYRVRLGGFATRSDASRYLAKLRVKENVDDALIVLNEQ
jgi:cell division septation protein DedD